MRTLILDIETVPNLAWVWGLWDQNIPINMLECPGEVACFAAKWAGNKNVIFSREITDAYALLDEADAVIHYNGKKFDIPHLNREFKSAGLFPPAPFKQIDLLHVVRKRFNLPSYKLQYVAQWLKLGGKADTGGFELWKGIMADDEKSWKKMERYNKQDVVLTEKVYNELLPWIDSHPSLHLYDLTMDGCPTCGSSDIHKRGFAYTKVSRFQQYQCQECGSYFRNTKRIEGVHVQESAL